MAKRTSSPCSRKRRDRSLGSEHRQKFLEAIHVRGEQIIETESQWWFAMHLIGSSKKGISSHQLHRMLGISYKSTWFMMHRIREAMRSGDLAPMGGLGGIVEADKTFIGRKEGSIKRRGHGHKNAILSLVTARASKCAPSISMAQAPPI